MYQNKKISLILPAYNEEECVAAVINGFAKQKVFDEIIVVDNNSKDKTAQLARKTGQAKVIKEIKQGYGNALQKGMKIAKGDILILCDTDNTYTPEDVFKLLNYADKYDCIFSTRTNSKFNLVGSNMNGIRRLANILVGRMIQLLYLGPSMTDPGATFRLIGRDGYEKIKSKFIVGGVHFQPELTSLALLHGLKIKEIPVRYGARVGESKISGPFWGGFKTARKMVGIILYYRLKSWQKLFMGKN